MTGSVGQKRVPAAFFSECKFQLPPLNEQRRIVAKLEKLLGKVNACQQRLDNIPRVLKRFRQAVLAAVCSGSLTADWREENQHIASLKTILCQINREDSDESGVNVKAKRKAGDERRIPYPEEGFFNLPDKWLWVEFGQIVNNHDSQRVPVKQADRAKRQGPYPYYGAFGIIDQIDSYRFDGTYLLLAEDGKNLESRTRPIALRAVGKFWVNNHAHALTAKLGISLNYLEVWLNSSSLIIAPFLTGIDQVKLNREAMDQIPVPLPPIAEQHEIIRRAEAFFKLADQLEARYQKAKAHVDKLQQSILAKAFRGELVPQNPNDEPASVLLERIRAERAEGVTSDKQKKQKPATVVAQKRSAHNRTAKTPKLFD